MSGISKRGCISVAAVMAADGSALTAGHFRKARKPAQSKVTKALMPHHLAPRLGSVCPHSGIAPWARREGPSMAQRGYPGIHAGMPTPQCLRSASVVNGAPRSTSSPRRPDSRPGSPGRTPIRSVGAKLAPIFNLQRTQNSYPTQTSCGSEPARDEACKPNIHVIEPPSSRASSLPHSIFSGHIIHIQHRPPVGTRSH